jgi:hypothetical protein
MDTVDHLRLYGRAQSPPDQLRDRSTNCHRPAFRIRLHIADDIIVKVKSGSHKRYDAMTCTLMSITLD